MIKRTDIWKYAIGDKCPSFICARKHEPENKKNNFGNADIRIVFAHFKYKPSHIGNNG